LLPGVEADVARAEAVRIALLRLEAERRAAADRASLAILIGVEGTALELPVEIMAPSESLPDGRTLEQQALRLRGELGAAEMERRVLEHRLSLLGRERVPNPTISAFLEQGEINDRIVGIGLSLPLPLPTPIGRTRAGEIAETVAEIRAAESSIEMVRRRVRLEVARGLAAYQARGQAAALFASDLLPRARADLLALREAIATRQLSLREGLLWQRSLIELLQADIEARLSLARTWVEVHRVTGLPFTGARGAGP
jgi:cobalt-zinc-cadmium efflux system outer membrane protein